MLTPYSAEWRIYTLIRDLECLAVKPKVYLAMMQSPDVNGA